MQDFDKKAHWQNVYEQKAVTEVSWFENKPTISLDLIAQCGLSSSAPIIDVGGGASTLVDQLIEQGHTNLTVLDISGAALESTQDRLGKKADAVNWVESDVTTFSPEHQFIVWHDRALFHFLTDKEDRRRYVSVLKDALQVGGYLILASFAVGGPEKCSGLPIVQYDAQKLRSELGSDFKLIEVRAAEHTTPAQRVQKFAYFRFQRVAETDT